MSDFNLVYSEFWPEAVARGWNDDMKLFGLYVLTCKHREISGLYHLPMAYAADDLEWTTERAWDALDALILDGFVAYDERARVLLIRKALKRLAPNGAKQVAGALAAVKRLPPTSLIVDLVAMAKTYSDEFAEALTKGIEGVSEGYPAVGIRSPSISANTPSVDKDIDVDKDLDQDKDLFDPSQKIKHYGLIERATISGEAA